MGSDLEVIVVDVEPSGRRIRLSRKAVLDATEKHEAREYRVRQNEAEARSGGFGSLADSLRKAIDEKSK